MERAVLAANRAAEGLQWPTASDPGFQCPFLLARLEVQLGKTFPSARKSVFAVSGELGESFVAAWPGHAAIAAHVRPGQRMRRFAHAVGNQFAVWPLPVEQRDRVFVRSDLDQRFG